jgi:adenylate kinase family enzyme
LVEFYRQRGLLIPISADGTPEQVFQRTLQVIEKPAVQHA